MKVFFAEAKYEGKVSLPKNVLDKLPKKVMFFMTAQLIGQKEQLKAQLEKAGKKVVFSKQRHCVYEGQLLGCNTEKINGDFDAFFYVGDGMFHPEALMMKNDQPIHIYNHIQKKYSVLTTKDSFVFRKRIAIAKTTFESAKNVGVLVTTKPGQNKLNSFMKIKKDYPDKNFYYLLNNNIEFDRLEDFPFIECFVNTACERIAYDDYKKFRKPIINFEDLS
ncbi:MAG: diphthamide synthesis protein [Nanoarchaeota archaeon]|nr:diphthamide synthesis protein [Nanoarchaeota archaeon]MBU1269821.1 diphthamide synthesis protein [Nanoarchaeota archaeon]MBU1604876.1 diphthamide synthesis protein [Nanoarchaeota archaeon]MBU2443153.1 diphthamide synthesis protein [Nanoarchaeota archaeon]